MRTASFGRVRSPELKALDNALKAYAEALKNSSGSVLSKHPRRKQRGI